MRDAVWRGARSAVVIAGLAAAMPATADSLIPTPQIVLSLDLAQLPDPAAGFADLPLVRIPVAVAPDRVGAVDWVRERAQMRSAHAVVDLHPVRGSGLRMSAGTRFHAGYAQTVVAPDTRLAMRVDPWGSRGQATLGNGYRSYAPVALLGYDHQLSEHWKLGIDAGAMRGRMATIYPFDGSAGRGSGPRTGDAERINPVMDFTLTHAF